MTARSCPSCGSHAAPEARFCRQCGVPLKAVSADNGLISPLARTIPLTDEGSATGGLTVEEPHHPASKTSRVSRAEMEDMLRRASLVESPEDEALVPEESHPRSISLALEASPPAVPADYAAPITSELKLPPATAATRNPSTVNARRMGGPIGVIGLLSVIFIASIVFAYFLFRSSGGAISFNANSAQPSPTGDHKVTVEDQLSEASTLLASGDTSGAIERLRSVVKLDPANAEAQRRLGEALEKSGARPEAIEAYRAATQNDPNNTVAWHELATAQFAEGRFGDSVESYRRLVAAIGEDNLDDNTRLEYADALRLAGRTEEARATYQRVTTSASDDLARTAKQRLAELEPLRQTAEANVNGTRPAREELARNRSTGETAVRHDTSAEPAPSPTPRPVSTPSAATSAGSRAAQSDPDALFYRALGIVNGRDMRTLKQAELVQALQYFLLARRGSHGAEASKYADRLGQEYDRRRNHR